MSRAERRKRVLVGKFMDPQHSGSADKPMWRSPRWKMVVFVSSTFTDTYMERNILLGKILPLLRTRAQSCGNIEVSFVDMRFGVRDEATLNHNTWVECALELKRCHDSSTGLFFLSLQGEKYGYRPLPRTIDQKRFDALVYPNKETEELAAKWYKWDSNSSPPCHCLKNLTDINDSEFWQSALPKLIEIFENLPLDHQKTENLSTNYLKDKHSSPMDLIVGRSVTEWELVYASQLDPRMHRCCWAHRTFLNGISPQSDSKRHFNDAIAPSVSAKLARLKQYMHSKFATDDAHVAADGVNLSPGVLEFNQLSLESYLDDTSLELKSYLEEWETKIGLKLTKELDSVLDFRAQWLQDGCGVGLCGKELQEMLHHSEWAHTKCLTFFGRTELLQQSAALIHARRQAWSEYDFLYAKATAGIEKQLGAVSLLITGESGSGKSAFMAKLADMLYFLEFESEPCGDRGTSEGLSCGQRRPVIVRFCGTSAASSTGLCLVQSICRQIEFVFADPLLALSSRYISEDEYKSLIDCVFQRGAQNKATSSTTSCPADYAGAVKYLHHLLRQHAVILIIDSLDQLSDFDRERSALSFLAGVHTHIDTRIIVSSLPDKYDHTAADPLANW
jgi:hypothetical protein